MHRRVRLSIILFCLIGLSALSSADAAAPTPAWRDQAKVAAVLAVLADSWTEGFDPRSYHIDEIRAEKDPVKRDALLDDAVIRYGRDAGGPPVKASGWHAAPDAADILRAVTGADDPARALADFAPQDGFYRALREEMRRLAAEKDRPVLVFGAMPFGPGMRDRAVADLRARLGVKEGGAGPADFYDDDLGAAVMRFQRRNSLPVDGVIDAATLARLNRTVADSRMQVTANLERLRWLDRTPPSRYVLVNIPTQRLWAMADGRVALNMPVAVGRRETPTPSFRAEITGIRFNPAWTVPPGIKARDLLPQLQENPHALDGTGIEFIEGQGKAARTLSPASIDWARISPADLARIRMVQAPGSNNALGRIRVLMPNGYDVYLHDTDAPEVFGLPDRADSSGCVRLSQPQALARFVLGWSDAQVQAVLAKSGTADVAAAAMPVYLVYQTMSLDAAGGVVYGPDPYGEDAKLAAQLRAASGNRG